MLAETPESLEAIHEEAVKSHVLGLDVVGKCLPFAVASFLFLIVDRALITLVVIKVLAFEFCSIVNIKITILVSLMLNKRQEKCI